MSSLLLSVTYQVVLLKDQISGLFYLQQRYVMIINVIYAFPDDDNFFLKNLLNNIDRNFKRKLCYEKTRLLRF